MQLKEHQRLNISNIHLSHILEYDRLSLLDP
jgi:hypothetical protein